MNQTDMNKIVSEIWKLEQKCQLGENISENTKKMENIFKNLSLSDLFQIIDELEKFEK